MLHSTCFATLIAISHNLNSFGDCAFVDRQAVASVLWQFIHAVPCHTSWFFWSCRSLRISFHSH
ncbi:hypothetical protein [Helicobacter cinaedi]|uniref:hypothetical protein n=1 Tax=Helicobacter cinaedi TaxID=213 RepID=UPI0015F25456|nr:hypothetical protein [Helicobacter cinaedi]